MNPSESAGRKTAARETVPGAGWIARWIVLAIRLYQATLSRCLGRVCRFEPSCSVYAIACLERRGLFRGGLLSLRRVCKCHPFHPGGFDLPPPPRLLSSTPPSQAPEPPIDPYAAD